MSDRQCANPECRRTAEVRSSYCCGGCFSMHRERPRPRAPYEHSHPCDERLLPGPDDIVVSREDVQALLDFSDPATQLEAPRPRRYPGHAVAKLRAALSQPHPEETP